MMRPMMTAPPFRQVRLATSDRILLTDRKADFRSPSCAIAMTGHRLQHRTSRLTHLTKD